MAMGERLGSTGDPVSLKQLSTSLTSTESFVLLGGGATMWPNMRSGVASRRIIFLGMYKPMYWHQIVGDRDCHHLWNHSCACNALISGQSDGNRSNSGGTKYPQNIHKLSTNYISWAAEKKVSSQNKDSYRYVPQGSLESCCQKSRTEVSQYSLWDQCQHNVKKMDHFTISTEQHTSC